MKRETLFFFGDYQGTRVAEGIDTGLISVPTVAERAGDFSGESSALTGRVGGPYLAQRLSQKLGYNGDAGRAVYHGGVHESFAMRAAGSEDSGGGVVAGGGEFDWVRAASEWTGKWGRGTFSTSAAEQAIRDDKGALRVDWNTRMGSIAGYYLLDDYTVDVPIQRGQAGRRYRVSMR